MRFGVRLMEVESSDESGREQHIVQNNGFQALLLHLNNKPEAIQVVACVQ